MDTHSSTSPPRAGGPTCDLLSVVVPCFNEEAVLPETHRHLTAALAEIPDTDFEIIYVDDGSEDATWNLLREFQRADSRVRVLALSRNFGQQAAITAGLQHARGNALVVIDADLQDPPEVILEMAERWRKGVDVAYGVRLERKSETAFKRWTSRVFHRLMTRISDVALPVNISDFRLMDRRVVDILLAMPERDRFMRGMVAWVGFRQEPVPFRQQARLAGETRWPLKNMLSLAVDGIVSFSFTPLRMATWVGFVVSGLALSGIVYAVFVRLSTNAWVSGVATVFIAVLFLGGVQLILIGVLGEYLGRIYGEVKRRPLYLVRERLGFPAAGEPGAGEVRDDA